MSKYLKPPIQSTSFSESGKKAKRRYENNLNTKAKKTGASAFVFILCAILIACTFIACNNQNSNDSIENTGGTNGDSPHSDVPTGNIHDYMPELLAGEAVSSYELLPCLENFTHGIWNELNTVYGAEWWNILLSTLNEASIDNNPADGFDQSQRNYYIGKAFLVSDGAYAEGLSGIMMKQWEHDRILYSNSLSEHFTEDEEIILRSQLTNAISNKNSLFGLFIPDSGSSICLDAYPVDFPFGCNLIEKSRKSYRAESFGQVTVIESDGLQVTYLNNYEGVYLVTTLRTQQKQYAAAGIAIGDTEEFLLGHRAELKKIDSISYDDEAWFGEYDSAYAYTPKESTKSIVFLIKDGMVSGIELIDGLDGSMY